MENVNLDFWTLIQQGAISTYPLLACSVLVLGVAIERAIALRGALGAAARLTGEVVPLVWRGGFADAASQVQRSRPSPLKRIYAEVLECRERLATPQLERLASDRQFEEIQGAGAYLWILGTIGAAAPFIGLFGTVVGIIRAFHAMALAGTGGFAVVAAGISEALIATALGLAVGIVAVVLYNSFQARVEQIDAALRIGSARLLEALGAEGRDGHR
ncbi:MAG TPA: MotA/TolQ/ExbB proton channel family protein [Candidatus Limnocylindria bacterium]|nr:MotA/TolQ/ExbB proton channel family protein [Candidatus Limnocylindria bacterium]